ncbi:MAG: DUF445 family protein [Spirochaetaceae bacterium]|nr:MAG: DUF445 family protein [Spirochaetaceae bacterium]
MIDRLISVLPFTLPPIVGAAIGYVTNAIAIKMLFRPLAEKRILGLRVPLTPGIIPRQRHQLAVSIGRMVSEKLLTEDSLRGQLYSPKFQTGLRVGVEGLTEGLLSARVNGVDAAAVPTEPTKTDVDSVIEVFYDAADGLFRSFVASDAFRSTVTPIADRVVRSVMEIKLDAVLPEHETTSAFLRKAIAHFLPGEFQRTVVGAAERWFDEQLARNAPVGVLLKDGLIETIESAVSALYGPVIDEAVRWADRPEIRGELTTRGKVLLTRILSRLNLFQRFIITAGQFDRVLNDKMPDIVNDMIHAAERGARDPLNKQRIVSGLTENLRRIAATGIVDFADTHKIDAKSWFETVIHGAVAFVEREDVQNTVVDIILRVVEKHRDGTLEDVLKSVAEIDADAAAGYVGEMIQTWLSRPENIDSVSDIFLDAARSLIDRLRSRAFGDTFSISSGAKAKIDAFLTDRITNLVDGRLNELVDSFDVNTMVVQKIDGLDMENVEQLLLMVIARHLKWINVFGAILGSLIGGVQVLVMRFL